MRPHFNGNVMAIPRLIDRFPGNKEVRKVWCRPGVGWDVAHSEITTYGGMFFSHGMIKAIQAKRKMRGCGEDWPAFYLHHESGEIVSAFRVSPETFGAGHPNPRHMPGIVYDPVKREATLANLQTGQDVTAREGDWLIPVVSRQG